MKFLLDANLPYSAKEAFPNDAEVIHVRDVSLSSATDARIFLWAQKNQAVIITRDFDFSNIVTFPPAKHCGILILKIRSSYTAQDIKRVLKEFFQGSDIESFERKTIIIEEGRQRIRE